MSETDEVVGKVADLAMEVRIRADMVRKGHRRGNLTHLRQARRAAKQLSRLAADLAAIAFRADDLLESDIRLLRNHCE